MARPRRTDIVDGYSVLKAAQRGGPKVRPAAAPEQAGQPQSGGQKQKAVADHIGHTAMPTRHELTCYECGYTFQMTGRAEKTFCPKCRQEILLGDITIDGPWSEELKTGGQVIISPTGIIENGSILAADIRLHGQIKAGNIQCTRGLIVEVGGKFSEASVEARDLELLPGADITLKRKHTFRKLALAGRLKASVTVEQQAVIHPGGVLDGRIETASMIIEDGGGLRAKVKLHPPDKA